MTRTPSRGTANVLPDMGGIQDTLRALLPEEQANQAADLVQQALIAQLPEQHYLTRHLKRKGVRGEETDMRRVFSAHAKARAHYLGHLTFAKRYSDAMRALLEVREDETSPYDRELVTTAWNEFQKRSEISAVAPHSPVTNFVVQWSALAHLALSPAYFLTNLSQVPIITAPWISARLDPGVAGFDRTLRALWKGGKDIAKVLDITRSGIDVESDLNLEAKDATGRSILTDGEQTLLRRAVEESLLNTGIEIDLGLVASGQDGGIQRLIQTLSVPVRITEQLNRGATALATYRLALAKGMTDAEATALAFQAIHRTHYDYTPEHAPRHMRQVLGSQSLARVVFQFRRYQLGTLHLLFSSLKQGWYDTAATDTERAEARRTILGIAAMTTAFGGVLMGTPFVGMILAIMSFVFGLAPGSDDDEPWDLATDIRNWLHDIDPTLADVIAKGLPSLLDMDLSQRIGMGNIAHPVPFMRSGDTGRDDANNALLAVLGAPFSNIATAYSGFQTVAGWGWDGMRGLMLGNGLDGFSTIMDGQVSKGVEQILPLKAAKDLMAAYRMATQGQRTSTGEQRLTPDDFSGWEIMLRGMGIRPMTQSDYHDASNAIFKRRDAAQKKHTELVGEYARAIIEGQPTRSIRREITAYNQRHPENGLRITQAMLTRAVKSRRQLRRDTTDAGILIQKADRPFAQYGRFAENR